MGDERNRQLQEVADRFELARIGIHHVPRPFDQDLADPPERLIPVPDRIVNSVEGLAGWLAAVDDGDARGALWGHLCDTVGRPEATARWDRAAQLAERDRDR